MDDVKIVKMEFPDEKGGISLTARSPAFAAFAEECVKMFKEDGGVNYVEWRMSAGEPGFGIFTVCIQREAGETPAQQNGRLREELRQANLQVNETREMCAKIVEAHKVTCKNFHDDCAAQVAAEIRGYIEKREDECPACNGRGFLQFLEGGEKTTCALCHGNKKV